MIQAHTFRRLTPLRRWQSPDKIAQQLEQVRICDAQERERQMNFAIDEFERNYGLGISHD
jgi:hypothetical protein